jgi:hypothetical protein
MKRIKPFASFIKEEESNGDIREYSFEELSPEAKRNALDDLRDINVEYSDWHESVIEDFEGHLKEFGVGDVEVSYSGFYSQGDGASFTGDVFDTKIFMSKALGLKNSEFLDMGEEEKPEDEGSRLRADLLDIGFDTREKLTPDNFMIKIERTSNRYSHENTIEGRVDIEDIPESLQDEIDIDEYENQIMESVTDWARSVSRDLYRDLENYYDDLMSDESVEDTILANDYKFDKDGNLK